jgi:hypothetical protein
VVRRLVSYSDTARRVSALIARQRLAIPMHRSSFRMKYLLLSSVVRRALASQSSKHYVAAGPDERASH